MTALAVVIAGVLVGWIRFTAPSAADPAPAVLTEEVPETFGGQYVPAPVPEAVAAAVEGPVVGVVTLDEVPEEADVCGFPGSENRELVWALVTPEGLQFAYVSDEPPWEEPHAVEAQGRAAIPVEVEVTAVPLDEPVPAPTVKEAPELDEGGSKHFESCGARWERDGWVGTGGMGMALGEDGRIPADIGVGSSCCDHQGFATVNASMAPVEGTAWLLQDRGGYWLAYPAEEWDVVPLTWRYRHDRFGRFGGGRTPSTHVLSVDADGTVLDERYVGG